MDDRENQELSLDEILREFGVEPAEEPETLPEEPEKETT